MKEKETLKNRITAALKKLLMFFLNPRLLLCVGIAWMITNGWSYIFATVGASFGITWMTVAGGFWLGVLWLPFTPEKIVTLLIAMGLMKFFFPSDEKTLGVLHEKYASLKIALKESAARRRAKREARRRERGKRLSATESQVAE